MRPFFLSVALAALFLAACAATSTPEPVPTFTPAPVVEKHISVPPTVVQPQRRAPLLRIAVLKDTSTTNVWALFDEAGADYWNAAPQASYWPSLYHLAPPSLAIQPVTAKGEPPPILCEDVTCTAKVTLRPGLAWTDGSAFSAIDVAFTINTALQFRLGLNWRQFYNPDVLDHAEALDEFTVKLYFKSHPTVGDWQYGALQGPVVNRAYWQPRIADAIDLLPDQTLLDTIQELEGQQAWMQAELNGMRPSVTEIVPDSTADAEIDKKAERLKNDLIGVQNSLEKKRAEYEAKLADARAFLFRLDNTGEPTLGPWKFSSREEGQFENRANLGTPFGDPWFDTARYITYRDEASAVNALIKDQVDLVLTPDGLSPESVSRLQKYPEISLNRNRTRSGRFLAFNGGKPYLADPVLHLALACMIDPGLLLESLGSDAAALSTFVLDDFWQYEQSSLPCANETADGRLAEAVRLLKLAGYSWDQEPAPGVSGSPLKAPDGTVLPDFSLLTVVQDPMRSLAAVYIAKQVYLLGLTLDVRMKNADDVLYAVYGSENYDMALLGWRLGAYPAYLCEWFTPFDQNPFAYNGSRHRSACEAWAQVNDLDQAKAYASEAHSALMQDLPLIPLFVNVRVDAYRNIHYPFTKITGGPGGLYGAPNLAVFGP